MFQRKQRTLLRGRNLMTVSHRPHLERQHLMTRIQPFLYTVHSKMSLRSRRWNMTTKCRSSSVIPSTMCTSKMRVHYGFLPLTVSCTLPALVRYTATCYWHRVFSSVPLRHQSICLSIRHIRPTCYYIIVSRSRRSRHTLSCVLAAIKDVGGFGDSSTPKDTCDEEVRHLEAFLNEWRGKFIELDYTVYSCLSKSRSHVTYLTW